jgi:hypothetical protein
MQRVVQLDAATLVRSIKRGLRGSFMKVSIHDVHQLETADQLKWCNCSCNVSMRQMWSANNRHQDMLV